VQVGTDKLLRGPYCIFVREPLFPPSVDDAVVLEMVKHKWQIGPDLVVAMLGSCTPLSEVVDVI
jgi:hypothetical protein